MARLDVHRRDIKIPVIKRVADEDYGGGAEVIECQERGKTFALEHWGMAICLSDILLLYYIV